MFYLSYVHNWTPKHKCSLTLKKSWCANVKTVLAQLLEWMHLDWLRDNNTWVNLMNPPTFFTMYQHSSLPHYLWANKVCLLMLLVGISCKLSKFNLFINKCSKERLQENCNSKYQHTPVYLMHLIFPSFVVLKYVKITFPITYRLFCPRKGKSNRSKKGGFGLILEHVVFPVVQFLLLLCKGMHFQCS